MGCENNSPKHKYISIRNLIIKSEEVAYVVNDLYTKSPYVYWNKNNPNVIFESDTRDSSLGNLIIKNDKGIHFLMNNSNIKLVFDGLDKEVLTSKVKTLAQKTYQYEKEASFITKAIDSLSEEYKQNKSFTEIKEIFNTAIINLNSKFISIHSTLIDYLSDNVFTDYEKSSIEYQFYILKNKSIEALAYTDALIDLCYEYIDVEENKENIELANNYKKQLEELIAKLDVDLEYFLESDNEKVTSEDMMQVTLGLSNSMNTIENLKNICNELIFLGGSGTIVSEVSSANLRIDDVILKISQLQETLTNTYDEEKKEVQDYFNTLRIYGNKTNTLFCDVYNKGGKVNNSDYGNLRTYITSAFAAVSKIETVYEGYYNSPNLTDDHKTLLKKDFETFRTSFNNFEKATVTNLKDREISTDDFRYFSQCLYEYRNAYNTLCARIVNCINVINNTSTQVALSQVRIELENSINKLSLNIDKRFKELEGRILKLEEGLVLE